MNLHAFRKGMVRLEGDFDELDGRKGNVAEAARRSFKAIEKLMQNVGFENVGIGLV